MVNSEILEVYLIAKFIRSEFYSESPFTIDIKTRSTLKELKVRWFKTPVTMNTYLPSQMQA